MESFSINLTNEANKLGAVDLYDTLNISEKSIKSMPQIHS
jgi:hypothetical protein